ncbi:MAG TPA: hypothetical protein VEU31_03205 [Candidatus Acidoferrales bacterium]|nr:hypothetical protein [Candidatus Acidoferrales bacterium]
MNLGHSSNVHIGDAVYHVQTEDRGADHPFIDTTVYASGRVLHRRTTSYYDVLNMDGDLQETLRKRVEDQHHSVIEELRSGALKLAPPSAPVGKAPQTPSGAAGSSSPSVQQLLGVAPPEGISVKLLNAASWASAGKARLHIEVRTKESAHPQAGAKIQVTLEGAQTPTHHEAETNEAGVADVQFGLPKLGPEGGTLVIRASFASAGDELRFQLKPRSPKPAPVP